MYLSGIGVQAGDKKATDGSGHDDLAVCQSRSFTDLIGSANDLQFLVLSAFKQSGYRFALRKRVISKDYSISTKCRNAIICSISYASHVTQHVARARDAAGAVLFVAWRSHAGYVFRQR